MSAFPESGHTDVITGLLASNTYCSTSKRRPGRFRVETQGLPSPDNPKTSMLTAYIIYRSIQNLDASIVI